MYLTLSRKEIKAEKGLILDFIFFVLAMPRSPNVSGSAFCKMKIVNIRPSELCTGKCAEKDPIINTESNRLDFF
jgi:hypothetical protein